MKAKEIKQKLQEQYPYRIEMHAHTSPCSPCAEVSPGETVNIYSKLGYDAIVLANHFSYGYGFLQTAA